MSLWVPPEPTLTVLASAEFQSEATGGCSGSGRLALRSSMISDLGLLFESMIDYQRRVSNRLEDIEYRQEDGTSLCGSLVILWMLLMNGNIPSSGKHRSRLERCHRSHGRAWTPPCGCPLWWCEMWIQTWWRGCNSKLEKHRSQCSVRYWRCAEAVFSQVCDCFMKRSRMT